MLTVDTNIYIDNFRLVEGLRWHDNKLWFCDLWDQRVYCFASNDEKVHEIAIDDQPVGLGWLSDQRLLITSLFNRQLLQYQHNHVSLFKDLACAAPGYCHDFTISIQDVIYLSASGFYPSHNVTPVKSNILMITPDKKIAVAATDIGYPNGIIITPDGKQVIVAETFAGRLSIFDIADDFTLINRKIWYKFDALGFQVSFDKNVIPEDKERHYPDGICYDVTNNAVWVASPGRREVVCVDQNNKVLHTIKTKSHPFDCTLGGKDGNTLFIGSSDVDKNSRTGKIEYVTL